MGWGPARARSGAQTAEAMQAAQKLVKAVQRRTSRDGDSLFFCVRKGRCAGVVNWIWITGGYRAEPGGVLLALVGRLVLMSREHGYLGPGIHHNAKIGRLTTSEQFFGHPPPW